VNHSRKRCSFATGSVLLRNKKIQVALRENALLVFSMLVALLQLDIVSTAR
jgi:hypothetical protein